MNKNYRLPAIVCALAVCLALCFAVAAWDGPSGNPPDSNIAAPINAGSEAQYKTGGLGLKIGGAVTYWISQVGNNLVFKTGNDFGTAAETVNINADGRIGNVSPAIDDNDVVIKAQLDAAGGGGSGYGTCDGDQLFVKFTAATYTGDLDGVGGANAKCAAEYPGYHFCQSDEWNVAGRAGCLPLVGQYGAIRGWWNGNVSYPPNADCDDWTDSTITKHLYGTYLSSLEETGSWGASVTFCSDPYSLACCK